MYELLLNQEKEPSILNIKAQNVGIIARSRK